jgi:hypothetical protein
VEQNVEQKAIAALLERQHRTIVEAIRRGRLSDLSGKTEEVGEDEDTTVSRPSVDEEGVGVKEPSLDQVILGYLEAQREKAHLILRATGNQDFVYGQTANVKVTAIESHSNHPQQGVHVAVLFKSTAEPRRLVLAEGETDANGAFSLEARLPPFNGGTSAVVITAQSPLGQSEIKHLVHR